MKKSQILKEVERQIKELCVSYHFNISKNDLEDSLYEFGTFQLDMIKTSYINEIIVAVSEYNDDYFTFEVRLFRVLKENSYKCKKHIGEINHHILLINMNEECY